MPDEQVVQFGGLAGDFAQGGGEQVVPEAALDTDGFAGGGAGVELGQGAEVALAGGAGGAQVLFHRLAVDGDAFQGKEGVVAQPFVEERPAVGGFQGKEPGARQAGRAGAGPAQQPALAVGEDAHTDALAGGAGLFQVVVQLGDMGRVGGAAGGGADAALEFNEGVQGGEVHGLAAAVGGRVFLHDGVALRQAGKHQEVADGGGDVGLRLIVIVAGQDGAGGGVAGGAGVQVVGGWVGGSGHNAAVSGNRLAGRVGGRGETGRQRRGEGGAGRGGGAG